SPSTLSFTKAGQTKTVALTFARTKADLGSYAFGTVTITSSKAFARLPVAVQPVAVSAPGEVSGTGTSGSKSFSVTPGATGSFDVTAAGLVPATTERGQVQEGARDAQYPVDVPE